MNETKIQEQCGRETDVGQSDSLKLFEIFKPSQTLVPKNECQEFPQ